MTEPSKRDAPVVLITGASTGIGKACALELDRRQWRVMAGVRNESSAAALREEASSRLTPIMLDVTDQGSIAEATTLLQEATGGAGLAGLVNNAGIVVSGPLELIPIDQLRRQLEVNVVGQVAVTQAMLPLLRAGKGRIINISSISGGVASPYLGPYSASKFALEAISDALRGELRHWGISVSLVSPGPVDTPIWEKSQLEADQIAAEFSSDMPEPYRADLASVRQAMQQSAEGAMPVEMIVEAVVHALTVRRPKIRYYITWRTRLAFRAFRMLPDWVRDWAVRRELGLD